MSTITLHIDSSVVPDSAHGARSGDDVTGWGVRRSVRLNARSCDHGARLMEKWNGRASPTMGGWASAVARNRQSTVPAAGRWPFGQSQAGTAQVQLARRDRAPGRWDRGSAAVVRRGKLAADPGFRTATPSRSRRASDHHRFRASILQSSTSLHFGGRAT